MNNDREPARGYSTVRRWASKKIKYGRECLWHTTTGFKKAESDWGTGGTLRMTWWRPDGTIFAQWRRHDDTGTEVKEHKRKGPWLWGVTDQTEPTMPEWMKDDEQWQAALDAQRD